MAFSLGLLWATSAIYTVRAHGRGLAGSAVHIDAKGEVIPHERYSRSEEDTDFVEMLKKAKANIALTHDTAKMIRSEVRRHVPMIMESAAGLEADASLLATEEVNCSTSSTDSEPINAQLCRILVGNNTQVSGKLERAVKGLSLRPQSPNATEMMIADKIEDSLLSHLRAALWDMWFCAKRADPPCDPMTSQDVRVKAAREQAFDSLHAIHAHAQPPRDSAQQAAGHETTLIQISEKADAKPILLEREDETEAEMTKDSVDGTPVTPGGPWADNVINNMLTPPKVTAKLYDAIQNLDLDTNLQSGIVRIEKDEDGMMKKMKADLLILHECASMPDCPADGCCNPKEPTQAKYKQASHDAYKAYSKMENDDDQAKKSYASLLKNIAGTTTTAVVLNPSKQKGGEAGTKDKKDERNDPDDTPPTPRQDDPEVTKQRQLDGEDGEGDSKMLMIGIAVVGGLVASAVGFIVYTMKKNEAKKLLGEGEGEEGEEPWVEDWEGEGEQW